MKFMLSGKREVTQDSLTRWVFYFPSSFRAKRVEGFFDQKSGTLFLCESNQGCKVIRQYKDEEKRVQMSAKKWFPDLGGDSINPIEVEWKNGQLTAQIRPPVRAVYSEPIVTKKASAAPKITPKSALDALNSYVSNDDSADFEIVDGILKIRKTVITYL